MGWTGADGCGREREVWKETTPGPLPASCTRTLESTSTHGLRSQLSHMQVPSACLSRAHHHNHQRTTPTHSSESTTNQSSCIFQYNTQSQLLKCYITLRLPFAFLLSFLLLQRFCLLQLVRTFTSASLQSSTTIALPFLYRSSFIALPDKTSHHFFRSYYDPNICCFTLHLRVL
jgi:hypothetical protein